MNIVHVKEKGRQIHICVDFRDLNRACPIDEFSLSNVDLLVGVVVGHERFSFMDGYNGYNQIVMELLDAPKIAFRTPFSNYYYKVMSFSLKNASTTY